VGDTPDGLAATNDAVYVTSSVRDARHVVIARIDPVTARVVAQRVLSEAPNGFAASFVAAGDNKRVYVTQRSGILRVLNPDTLATVSQRRIGRDIAGVAHGFGSLWVADAGNDDLLRITERGQSGSTRRVGVGDGPLRIAIGTRSVFVSIAGDQDDRTKDRIAVIDPASASVTSSLPVGDRPIELAVGEDSVWVANTEDRTVSRADEP